MNYTVAEARKKLPQLIKEAQPGGSFTIDKCALLLSRSSGTQRSHGASVLGNKDIVLNPDWARPQGTKTLGVRKLAMKQEHLAVLCGNYRLLRIHCRGPTRQDLPVCRRITKIRLIE